MPRLEVFRQAARGLRDYFQASRHCMEAQLIIPERLVVKVFEKPPHQLDLADHGDLESAIESMERVPWTVLSNLKGDPDILKKIDDAEALLKSLRRAIES